MHKNYNSCFHILFPFDYNLKTIRNISMKLGTLIKHDEMMCHAKDP